MLNIISIIKYVYQHNQALGIFKGNFYEYKLLLMDDTQRTRLED